MAGSVATKVWLTTFTGQMIATLGKVAVGIFAMISRKEIFQKYFDADRPSLSLLNHHLLCCRAL
ncbi:hypothetical protein [Ligilactobacillus aviarius]|uniref:hypothetical protein n=1 Tax=Ligilactobacillus aviarius TaxID=1606 RepID=UPI0024B8A014|nr:hypothetical protein [Ligilactobacillus aviarius]